jgi:hypothetical protein
MVAALAACSQAPIDAPEHGAEVHRVAPSATLNKQLDQVRKATKGFQRFEDAVTAGYASRITECFEDSTAGGMGFHYGDTRLFDATVEATKPEVLLYEPKANGSFKLVGVEYIVPRSAWTSPTPPVLFGETFHYNSTFDIWALHAWIWKKNPAGVLTNWNPDVSCRFADRVQD